MGKKILILLVASLFGSTYSYAQYNSNAEFREFVKQRRQEMRDFRQKENEEFASFLKEYWKPYKREKPVPAPVRPEPIKPFVYKPDLKVDPPLKPSEQPEVKPYVPEPVVRPEKKPVVRPEKKPVVRPEEKPEVRPEKKPVVRPEKKPVVRPEKKPVVRPEKKPVVRPEKKPVVRPEKKPVVRPEKKPVVHPEKKPVVRPEKKPVSPVVPEPSRRPAPKAKHYSKSFTVEFYGTSFVFPRILDQNFVLRGISEREVSSAWSSLCKADYKTLLDASLEYKKDLNLCDWSYLLLMHKVAERICGQQKSDAVTFVQMFLLSQSGYKVKIGRMDNRLVLLVPTDCMLYQTIYLTLDNTNYFVIDAGDNASGSIYTYRKDFSSAVNKVSMHITNEQFLAERNFTRDLQCKRYKFSLSATLNQNLIDLYKDYPQCEFPIYKSAATCSEVYQSVLPALAKQIEGKSEAEAANILINFVQTAFRYQTDQEQFGYEKPFFVEEVFYYPYADCEDRSVLYAFLVRKLLKLDVVLLNYPRHLATAVCFNENVKGDAIRYDGKRYVICDPTYINAPIATVMPQYKNVVPEVIR